MNEPYAFEPARPWDDCGDEDPDSHSPRLRYYHQRLWSRRPLKGLGGERSLVLEPWGQGLIDTGLGMTFFGLDEGLFLKSDRVMATWWGWTDTAALREDSALMERILTANPVLDNMGGTLLWPGRQVGGQTLNQARGFAQKRTIADRLDLTAECVRRGYLGDFDSASSPLGSTLAQYRQFFELFGDFDGYVEFWLLEDLLTEDGQRVRSFMGGDLADYDFATSSPLPGSVEEYDEYLRNAQSFVRQRNARMSDVWQRLEASAD